MQLLFPFSSLFLWAVWRWPPWRLTSFSPFTPMQSCGPWLPLVSRCPCRLQSVLTPTHPTTPSLLLLYRCFRFPSVLLCSLVSVLLLTLALMSFSSAVQSLTALPSLVSLLRTPFCTSCTETNNKIWTDSIVAPNLFKSAHMPSNLYYNNVLKCQSTEGRVSFRTACAFFSSLRTHECPTNKFTFLSLIHRMTGWKTRSRGCVLLWRMLRLYPLNLNSR
mmetsp:Transcript_15380/g.29803  ORF Transcript_15380/g.29803 Transcript_15380/m.29803 type:complete len:219 (-) Transcript_15380:325-981(-)